jgi:hypothetical protein
VCASLFPKKGGTAGARLLRGPRKEPFWGRRKKEEMLGRMRILKKRHGVTGKSS